jgi:hypothetical protein
MTITGAWWARRTSRTARSSASRPNRRESAELRVLANNTVNLITGKTSTDPEADWAKLESYLRDCYRSIQKVQQQEKVGMT